MDDPLVTYINFARLLVERDRRLLSAFRGANMAKFTSVTERMKALKEQDAAEADKLMERMDAHEKRRPEITQLGHAWLDAQKQDMDEMERGLNALANMIPTEAGGDPPKS